MYVVDVGDPLVDEDKCEDCNMYESDCYCEDVNICEDCDEYYDYCTCPGLTHD